jgi:hypothetical protein
MNMFRFFVASVVAVLFLSATCAAGISVTVGDIVLEPNTADQVVLIMVSNGSSTAVQGLDFAISVGDGWGGPDYDHSGPMITDVDLIGPGTAFEANNSGPPAGVALGYSWGGSVSTSLGWVTPNGMLAAVKFDTTSVDPTSYGMMWDVKLIDALGNAAVFRDNLGNPVEATFVDGTVRINVVPEPGPIVLLASLACGALVFGALRWRRGRRAA